MSRQPWELDDDALFEAEGKGYHDWCAAGCPLNRIGAPLHKPFERRAIATAAQKRLVEWLEDENMNKDADWEASRTDVRLKYAEVQMDKGDLWIDFVSYATVRAALEVE